MERSGIGSVRETALTLQTLEWIKSVMLENKQAANHHWTG